jgi:hypothetical protein
LREAREETACLSNIVHYLGDIVENLPEGIWVVRDRTKVFGRPDLNSFAWAEFRTGIKVRELRRADSFVQLTFEEWDKYPDPEYVSYQITGWVPKSCLSRQIRRHYFHLEVESKYLAEQWVQKDEHHEFALLGAGNDLPEIVPPQYEWLRQVRDHFTIRGAKHLKISKF